MKCEAKDDFLSRVFFVMKSKFKYSFWQGPVGVRFATVWLRWHKISRPKGEESRAKQNKSNLG